MAYARSSLPHLPPLVGNPPCTRPPVLARSSVATSGVPSRRHLVAAVAAETTDVNRARHEGAPDSLSHSPSHSLAVAARDDCRHRPSPSRRSRRRSHRHRRRARAVPLRGPSRPGRDDALPLAVAARAERRRGGAEELLGDGRVDDGLLPRAVEQAEHPLRRGAHAHAEG